MGALVTRALLALVVAACVAAGAVAPAEAGPAPPAADVTVAAALVGSATIAAGGDLRVALRTHDAGAGGATGVGIVVPIPTITPLQFVAVYPNVFCGGDALTPGDGWSQYTLTATTLTVHEADIAAGGDGPALCVELHAPGDPSTAGAQQVVTHAHAEFADAEDAAVRVIGPDAMAPALTVNPASTLSLTLTAPSPNPVYDGWAAVGTVGYTNAGPSATRASLRVSIATGIVFGTPPAGCAIAGSDLTCTPADSVPSGGGYAISFPVIGTAVGTRAISATVVPGPSEIDSTSTVGTTLKLLPDPPPPPSPSAGLSSTATISPATGHGTITGTCGASGDDVCAVTATLHSTKIKRVHGKTKRVTTKVGTLAGRLGGGRSGRFAVRVTAAERRLLRRRKHLTVIVHGTSRNTAGVTVTVSKIVTLGLSHG